MDGAYKSLEDKLDGSMTLAARECLSLHKMAPQITLPIVSTRAEAKASSQSRYGQGNADRDNANKDILLHRCSCSEKVSVR